MSTNLKWVCTTTTSAALGVLLLSYGTSLSGQGRSANRDTARRNHFSHDANVDDESPRTATTARADEAPTGFGNKTNGLDPQGPDYDTLTEDTVVPLRSFNDNRFIFEEVETVEDGLGPTYNAQSCRECHQNIVTGGASQVTVQRAGHSQSGQFFDSQGGSLIQSRATDPLAMELVASGDTTRTFRISTNTLGDGFIEALSNSTILAIRDAQPAQMRGTAVIVPVLEANGRARVGRFGWKAQHASLVSFAADAYLNEMGITSPLLPDENSVAGADPAPFDHVDDPEDDGEDLRAFANFIRSTMAPPRGAATAPVASGEQVFTRVGCATCHVASLRTAPPNTVINGGAFTVPAALGNKTIHPFSDFLLHDVGTGDGIPIQPTAEYAVTANKIKTAPLWGLRTRNRLMHDGLSFTLEESILRHGGQAASVTQAFQRLSAADKATLIAFLKSL